MTLSLPLKAEVMSVYRQLFPLVSLCWVNLSGVKKRILLEYYFSNVQSLTTTCELLLCVADVALNSHTAIAPLCLTTDVIKF